MRAVDVNVSFKPDLHLGFFAEGPTKPRAPSLGVESVLVLVGRIEAATGKISMMSEMDHRLADPIADVDWASIFGRR